VKVPTASASPQARRAEDNLDVRRAEDHADVGGAEDHVDVSVLVPVLDEEHHIRETVATMQSQRFEGTIELLFADGRSRDGTREILLELAAGDPRIRVLENPRRGTASGLNVCLREARGEFVARMDAHTFYSERYLAAGVERLRRGGTEWVSGPAIPRPSGAVSRAVALALASWLGRGGSRKWSASSGRSDERQLDSGVFGGVWQRARLLEAGGWDERWPVNQDSEMAARFLLTGARLVCLPEMAGHYMPRDSLAALARQYFRYGFYRVRTFRRHPQSMRYSHLIAPALACVLVAAGLAPRRLRRASRLTLAAYLAGVAATGAKVAIGERERREGALLVAVLPVMHFGWGFGTLVGALRFGPPLAALAHLAGLPSRASFSDDGAGVYAPSLHRPA
jgi:glycosyltransferase involved in cell wall biosynthesis